MMQRAVVLLSGGMDSATLLHYVRRTLNVPAVHALSFRYGQKHARELEMARRQAARAGIAEHRVVDLSWFGELTAGASALTDPAVPIPDLDRLAPKARRQPPTYVPHRNLLFLAAAAGYAEARGARDVFYGAQAQDHYGYWDCTPDFVGSLNAVLGLNRGQSVQVHAPFAALSKADVLKIGLALGVNYAHTWTCYRGGERACGACPSCVERAAAFCAVGLPDAVIESNEPDSPSDKQEANEGEACRTPY